MRNYIYVKKDDDKIDRFLLTKNAEGGGTKNIVYIGDERYLIMKHTKANARGLRPNKIYFDNRLKTQDPDVIVMLSRANEVELF